MILAAGGAVVACAINSVIIETNFLNYYQSSPLPPSAKLLMCNGNTLPNNFLFKLNLLNLNCDKVKTMSNNSFADQLLISWVNIKPAVYHYLKLSSTITPHARAQSLLRLRL